MKYIECLIKIDTPEKFEIVNNLYNKSINDNGYLNYSDTLAVKEFDFSLEQYEELKSIISDKAKALLNLNHNDDIIRTICKNIIFNGCRFSIENVKEYQLKYNR